MFPQRLINGPVRRGWDWRGSDVVRAAAARSVKALGDNGRILLRPSGTEPVLRVMVEARDRALADEHAQAVAQVIAKAAGQQL
jgi:phosphoglucosamine mutase